MSLSRLPPELVAQICSHLEFKDITNLLQVNKRINGMIKYYKLDKPKIVQLCLDYRRKRKELKIQMLVTEKDKKLKTIEVINLAENADNISHYFDAIEKFTYIEEVFYMQINMNEPLAEKLLTTRTKIKHFHMLSASLNISEDVFFKLCDRFDLIHLSAVKYRILETDQFLSRVVKKCNVNIEGEFELIGILTDERETQISDAFLGSLEGEDAPTTFRIENWINNITVGGLRKLFEVVIAKNPPFLNWNFGLIKSAETEAARSFLGDIENGRYPGYKEESERMISWWHLCISRTDGLDKFEFSFCILDADYEFNDDLDEFEGNEDLYHEDHEEAYDSYSDSDGVDEDESEEEDDAIEE